MPPVQAKVQACSITALAEHNQATATLPALLCPPPPPLRAHPYSTSGSGGERGMKPGSVMLVTASMMSENAMSTPLMATSAQLMCSPTQGSTQTQKMTAGREQAGREQSERGIQQAGRKQEAAAGKAPRSTQQLAEQLALHASRIKESACTAACRHRCLHRCSSDCQWGVCSHPRAQ